MNIRTYLLTALILVGTMTSFAQDKIFKRSGEIINARVKEVGVETIIYKRFDNPEGPDYTIRKNDAEKVIFENGTIDKFETDYSDNNNLHGRSRLAKNKKKKKYDEQKNIIALVPTGMMVDLQQSGYSVGLTYERVFGEKGKIAFTITGLSDFCKENNYTYSASTTGSSSTGLNELAWYAMPGLKFYPGGNSGKVRYAIGPTFYLGTGKHADLEYVNDAQGYPHQVMVHKQFTTTGILITNSLNFFPNKHLYIGLDLNIGTSFSDDRLNSSNYGGIPMPVMSFLFRMGLRF